MVTIAVDSSVLIEHVRRGSGIFLDLVEELASESATLIIPAIVLFELWRGQSMEKKSEREIVEALLEPHWVVVINQEIAWLAGRLERRGQAIGNDALIAATCLLENAQLATLNAKDFSRVENLQIWPGRA